MDIKEKTTLSRGKLLSVPIKKSLILIAVIMWGILAFFTCYEKNYGLLKTIFVCIELFSIACLGLATMLYIHTKYKYKVFDSIANVAFLWSFWLLVTLGLIDCEKHNYFGVISPYILLPMSILTLKILLAAISIQIENKENYKNE